MLRHVFLVTLAAAPVTSNIVLSGEVCHDLDGQEYCASDQQCHADGQCDKCEGRLTEDIDTHECIDRVVFTTHLPFDIVSAVIWFIGAGLAMSAGVGGGGIFVPLGVILLRFPSKNSTGLSQASIFGASLAGLILNGRARHPKANRPLIDFDMALFLSPMEMAGALLGVIVQKILPTWAVIILMATILGYTAYGTYGKGFKTLKKERAAAREAAEKAAQAAAAAEGKDPTEAATTAEGKAATIAQGTEPTSPGVLSTQSTMTPGSKHSHAAKVAWERMAPPDDAATVEEWLRKDAAPPYTNLILLFIMWITLIALLLLKGGKGASGAVEYCSLGYWAVTALSFVWLFGFSLFTGQRAVSNSIQKAEVGYPFVEGDVIWSWPKFRFYCCATFAAGVVAGLIGIGGGMVLGPLMLQLGILPQVSSATTATMIALTSSAAAMLFVTSGLVPPSYAAFYFFVAFFGALVGKSYIDKLVQRCQLTSIIILILATIIAFASSMMTVNGIIIYSDRGWDFEGLNEVC